MVDRTMQNTQANDQQIMTNFYLDVEPLSNYSPVTLHLSPATRILNENPTNEYPSPPLSLNYDHWVMETQKCCCQELQTLLGVYNLGEGNQGTLINKVRKKIGSCIFRGTVD